MSNNCKGRKGCRRHVEVIYLGEGHCDMCLARIYKKQEEDWKEKEEKKVKKEE